jgi:dolichol-phosphate mannosyltransferase
MAGVERSKGDWVVVMDCDLQDKPEAIVDLYKKAEQGYDVVFARRVARKDSLVVKQLSKLYHSVLDFFTGTKTDNTIGNFSISKRIVIDNFLKLNEKGRSYQLFIKWVGFNQTFIDIEGDVRFEGKSSYNFRRKLKFALSTITSHSNRPLYVSIGIGALFVLASLIAIICLVVRRLLDPTTQLGWTSIMASIYLVGGLLMLSIGLIGIYIGNIFTEVKNRPIFIVAETTNLDDEVKGTK